MSFLSLNTWSLHRSLGSPKVGHWNLDDASNLQTSDAGSLPLTGVPALVASKGIVAIDVCHFHFEHTDADYLNALRQAFADARVRFYTLLVDYGDISNADEARRSHDIAQIKRWIDVASQVGAERVRVVAGESSPSDTEALRRAADALKTLVEYASERGVRIVTENFRSLASTPENCLYLRDACGGQLGLIADFGNFRGAEKYDHLSRILPHAENVHAKAHYDAEGLPDADEFRQCLALLPTAGYDGPVALVYDGPGDEWAGIGRVQTLAVPFLGSV